MREAGGENLFSSLLGEAWKLSSKLAPFRRRASSDWRSRDHATSVEALSGVKGRRMLGR
jgi:hypothetical protein